MDRWFGGKIGPGIAASVFWSPAKGEVSRKRSVGFKIGPSVGSYGWVYSFTASNYVYAPSSQATRTIKHFFNKHLRPPVDDSPENARCFTDEVRQKMNELSL